MRKKKRIVCFEIYSQGHVNNEWYELSKTDNAENVGQALVIWFNATGGNNDGSFRKFVGVKHDYHISEQEFIDLKEKEVIKTHTWFSNINPIRVLDEDYAQLLSDDYKRFRGE